MTGPPAFLTFLVERHDYTLGVLGGLLVLGAVYAGLGIVAWRFIRYWSSDDDDPDSEGGGGLRRGRRGPRRPRTPGPVSWIEFERQFTDDVAGSDRARPTDGDRVARATGVHRPGR